MNRNNGRLVPMLAAVMVGSIVAGCSSGSGSSDVGRRESLNPIARPLIMNSGSTNRVREGAEVLLTGRDSEDPDGPLLDWRWTGPATIDLITRNRTTVSFTAPNVEEQTELTFALTVTDTDGRTDTQEIDVLVVPAGDLNTFLAPLGVQGFPSDTVTLTAALVPGTQVGVLDVPFEITLAATVTYRSRNNVLETEPLNVPEFAQPLTGSWPADETVTCAAGQSAEDCMRASFLSSSFRIQVPRLDFAELNQRFFASQELGRLLDAHTSNEARVEITATFSAGELQQEARLLVSGSSGVIAQTAPSLIGVPALLSVDADELLDGVGGEEQRATAEAYYRTVDPRDRRTTLNAWLDFAGFTDGNGRLLPEVEAGTGEFAHAVYTNNFDLGFGRDMRMRVAPNGDVFAFVDNYTTLEAGLKKTDSFATVVMEFTQPDDPGLHASCAAKGRFVKFFTFVPDKTGDAQRVTAINFDGRGERYTPGNCVTCHGGTTANLDELVAHPTGGEPLFRDCGDTNATFMPFDLDSFLYSDTDPAIKDGAARPDGTSFVSYTDPRGAFRRAAQEEQFRKLNAAALSTYETYVAQGGDPARVANAIELVHGWYAGEPNTANQRFDGSYTPVGWNTSPPIADVYHTAFARHCRACHVLLADPSKQFESYDSLVLNPLSNPRPLEDLIFRRGIMPLARLSMDRFWVSFDGGPSPASVLADQLAADSRIGMDPNVRPGAPVFSIAQSPGVPKERDLVRLDARASAFVMRPQWTALGSHGGVSCVQPKLFAATTLEVAFRADTPGHYCIALVSGESNTVHVLDVNPNQPPQLVATPRLTIDENAAPTSINLEYADPDDAADRIVYTLRSVLNGTVSLNGTNLAVGEQFTQQQVELGFVQFDPSLGVNLAAGAIVAGGFDYSVTDGFASLGAAPAPALAYRVDIQGVNDGQPTVSVSISPASNLFVGGTTAIGSARISASDPDTSPAGLTIQVAIAPGSSGSIAPASLSYQQILNGSSFTFTHSGALDFSDVVNVRVTDGTFTSANVPLIVGSRVSFSNNIAPLIDNPSEPNTLVQPAPYAGEDCASCHNATGGGLGAPAFLSGANVDYAAISARVSFPETACSTPNSPLSLLLAKPSASVSHTGMQRPGFNLGPGGDRSGYDLIRAWICTFGAANN